MYPGYLYVLHASQPGKLKRVTFHTVESEPITEIQNVMGKTSTVYRVQLLIEGVEERVLNPLPPLLLPEVFNI